MFPFAPLILPLLVLVTNLELVPLSPINIIRVFSYIPLVFNSVIILPTMGNLELEQRGRALITLDNR